MTRSAGRDTESSSTCCQPGQPGMGQQLGGEVQPLRGVARQCDRRDRNRGRARLGGSVLPRTMAGKAVGERLGDWTGTLVGGWRVPALAWLQALPLQHNLLSRPGPGGGRVSPHLGSGCELSGPPPAHSTSFGQRRRQLRKGSGGRKEEGQSQG